MAEDRAPGSATERRTSEWAGEAPQGRSELWVPPDVRWLLLLTLGCSLALVVGAALGQSSGALDVPEPSQAVYPPHGYRVRFSHQEHSAREVCATCHPRATESLLSSDSLLPTMEDCGACHPQASNTEDPDACGYCHSGYRPQWSEGEGWLAVRHPRFPLVRPESSIPFTPNLIFSHSKHAEHDCQTCHPSQLEGGAYLPLMAQCLECHRAEGQTERCQSCHPSAEDGRLQTRFAGSRASSAQVLRPADHGALWLNQHKLATAADPTACFVCHSERDCLRCHDGQLANHSIHPPGYLQQHPASARRSAGECTACHQPSRFCVDCHIDLGQVSSETRRPPFGARLHPTGWLDAGGGEHGEVARRNLVECAGCHQESTCASCHSQVSPHGFDFWSRCGALRSANSRLCERCHGEHEMDMIRRRCP